MDIKTEHSKTMDEWVNTRIMPLLLASPFTTEAKMAIVTKLKRKESEKGWVIQPSDLNLYYVDEVVINGFKKLSGETDDDQASRTIDYRISLVRLAYDKTENLETASASN